MISNDVLRSVRYLLDLPDARIVDVVHLADPAFDLSPDEVRAWLLREDEPGYKECPNAALARFLDGLIVHLRGRDESRPPPPIAARVTNNLVLKKLRVAFALKDTDVQDVFRAADFSISTAEIGALCRQPGQRNYRACGDQILRNFLKGLSLRPGVRPGTAASAGAARPHPRRPAS